MKFSRSFTVPCHLHQLWQLSTSMDYHQQKYLTLGAAGFTPLHSAATEKTAELDFIQMVSMNIDNLPAFAKRVFSSEAHVQHKAFCQYISDHQYTVEHSAKAANIPVTIKLFATFSQQAANNCLVVFDIDIICKIPLIGEKIASMLVEGVEYSLNEEHQYILRCLENTEVA